jgi:hypothetical protein
VHLAVHVIGFTERPESSTIVSDDLDRAGLGSTSSSHTSQPLANAGFSCILAAPSVLPSACALAGSGGARDLEMEIDRSVPTTPNAPSRYSMSAAAAARRCAAISLPAAMTDSTRLRPPRCPP